MKCANVTDDCTDPAVAKIRFPWDDKEQAACAKHVGLAKQTMTNLNRLDELQVNALPLEEVAAVNVLDTTGEVLTPRDPPEEATTSPALSPVPSHALELRALTVKALELELELEKARHARVLSELELMAQIKARTESARVLFDHVLASVATFAQDTIPSFVAGLQAAAAAAVTAELEHGAGDAGELEPSKVEGAKPPAATAAPT